MSKSQPSRPILLGLCLLFNFLFTLISPGVLLAAESIVVSNTKTGQNIYEVVYSSDTSNTKLKPGIYAISSKGKTTPVILGDVLGVNKGFNGILEQISSNNLEDYSTSIAVVDNKVVLFNTNTKVGGDKDKRALTLGSTDFTAVDPLMGIPFLDEIRIETLDDINVFKASSIGSIRELAHGGEIVLVSIKKPNSFGDGVTFSFVLEPPSSSTGRPSILSGSASIISYHFFDKKNLPKLVINNSQWIYSTTQMQSTLQKNQLLNDDLLISRWSRVIDYFRKSLIGTTRAISEEQNKYNYLKESVPRFDAVKRVVEQQYYPARPLGKSLALYQAYNPTDNTWFVAEPKGQVIENEDRSFKNITGDLVFIHSSEVTTGEAISGRVNVDAKGKFKITDLAPELIDVNEKEYLISVGKSAVFLLRNREQRLKTLNVTNIHTEDLKNLVYIHRKTNLENGNIVHNLFVSALWKNRSKGLFAISFIEKNGLFEFGSFKHISNEFISRNELELRTQHSENGANPGYYIDLSHPIKGAAAYKKSLGQDQEKSYKALPYFYSAIEKSEMDGQKSYLRASTYIMGTKSGSVSFLQFGDQQVEKSDQSATGFYIDFNSVYGAVNVDQYSLDVPLFPSKMLVPFVAGVPLYFQKKKANPLSLDTLVFGTSSGLQLSAIPFQKSIRTASNKKFELLLTLASSSTRGISDSTPEANFKALTVKGDYENLSGAQIIKGLRKQSDDFHVLLFFGKTAESENSGVYVISGEAFKTNKGGVAKHELNIVSTGWLHKGKVSPAEIAIRVKADAKGNLYWIDNPEEQPNSLNFRVRKMSTPGSLVYINKEDASGQTIQLRLDEELQTEKSNNDLYSRWSVAGSFELSRRAPHYESYVNKLKKESEKKNSDKKDSVELGYNDSDMDVYSPYIPSKVNSEWKKLHKSSSMYFDEYLEALASIKNMGDTKKRQILLVEDRMKETLLNDMMYHLTEEAGDFTVKIGASSPFELFYYDTSSTLEESVKEFKNIKKRSDGRPTLLFGTVDELNRASELQSESMVEANNSNREHSTDEGHEDKEFGDDDRESENVKLKKSTGLSRWLMLATGGKSSNIKKLKSRIKDGVESDIPMLLVATPQELEHAIELNSDEYKKGVFDSFEINNQFLTGSWKQWAPKSQNASKAINEFSTTPVPDEEYRVFPTLEELFTKAAAGEMQGEQVVLMVSPELKPLIHRLVMAKWATLNGGDGWHHRNENLNFYQLQGNRSDNSQSRVFDNFNAMRGNADNSNVVLYSDLERIQQIGRPFNEKGRTFRLKDPISSSVASGILSTQPEEKSDSSKQAEIANLEGQLKMMEADLAQKHVRISESDDMVVHSKIKTEIDALEFSKENLITQLNELKVDTSTGSSNLPHLMWMIASEGERVQPKAKKDWSLANSVARKYATILIGTPDEWNMIEQDMGFESKYLDLKEHFNVVELNSPSEQVKFELVKSLIDRPEIQSLGYDFIIQDQSKEDAQRQLIHHFVNRVEQIASQKNMESTAAFIRAFSELRNTLIEDTALRRNRVIDKNFMERLFFKIFPLSISLENLEPNDPLSKLKNIPEAARQLQRLGYHGPMELKERTLDTILNQTRGSDAGRPIPNSQILFGGTGSGKTYMFKKIVEYLGLQSYDPNKVSNEEADYIIITVQNLVEEDNNESGKLTVDQAIEQIEDLISQPKGHRAFILFDDAHKTASAAIHQKLFSYIQSLFEAPSGVIRVKKRNSNEYKEVPVQNLNLYMTVNPTANKVQMDKYSGNESLNKKVLASLASHDVDMEDSILARWSDIIDLDKFPRGAKVPALVERIRSASSASNNTVLVSSDSIDVLVEAFPDANSREFLNPAASALTNIPVSAKEASLYIVSKRNDRVAEEIKSNNSGFLVSADFNQAVKKMTQVDAITFEDPSSIMKLVDFLIGNFRMQVFNNMVLSTQNTEALRLNAEGQSTILKKNFILSVMTHLLNNPKIPIGEMPIRGNEYSYFSEIEIEEVVDYVRKNRKKDYFPFEIGVRNQFSPFDAHGFLADRPLIESHAKSRKEVFSDTVDHIETILNQMLTLYTRFDQGSLQQVSTWSQDDIKSWFENLPKEEPVEDYKRLSSELIASYMKFVDDFYDLDLIESKEGFVEPFSIYDHGRMFSYLVDKAVTRLPWGLMSKFVVDVMSESSDLSLGQKPSFIQFAYHQNISPLSIVTNDFLNETFADEVKDKEKVKGLEKSFRNRCEISLTKKGGSNQ